MVRVLWAEPDVSKDARRLAHAEVFMGRALTDAEKETALDPNQILVRAARGVGKCQWLAHKIIVGRLRDEIRRIVRGRRDG